MTDADRRLDANNLVHPLPANPNLEQAKDYGMIDTVIVKRTETGQQT